MPPPPLIHPVSFEDYQQCMALSHTLYRAWDEGNFSLIEPYFADVLDMDFSAIGHIHNPTMPKAEFCAQQKSIGLFTDEHLRAQHIVNLPCLSYDGGPNRITNCFSLLARHARTTPQSNTRALTISHRCGTAWHYYEKVDGTWYFKGLKYNAGWAEGDRSGVFGLSTTTASTH